MTWAALFERADAFDVDQQAVRDALAARRESAETVEGSDDDTREDDAGG